MLGRISVREYQIRVWRKLRTATTVVVFDVYPWIFRHLSIRELWSSSLVEQST